MRFLQSYLPLLSFGILGFLFGGEWSTTKAESFSFPKETSSYETRTISGWKLQIDSRLLQKEKALTEKALVLLKGQLGEVQRLVPEKALGELRKVTIWMSPEYPGVPPTAEYHPDKGWLKDHGRNPAMAKGIEITDVRDFESECKRMPLLMLHELSHAYHDRVLGFDHPGIVAAYERAKASGKYDKVERKFANGNTRMEKAYAMTNPQEYFAECSEAYFGTNDWFPYNLTQLKKHDPEMVELLDSVWKPAPSKKAERTQKDNPK